MIVAFITAKYKRSESDESGLLWFCSGSQNEWRLFVHDKWFHVLKTPTAYVKQM